MSWVFLNSVKISSTLTDENWNISEIIGDIIDSNDTWILGCLLYLKIWDIFLGKFGKTWDIFSAKRLTSSNSEIFRLSTRSKKKVFKISAFSTSCENFITFYESNFFWRICRNRKQRLNSFSKLFIIHNISLIYN